MADGQGRLKDKVAIITGAARGTGEAIARLFVDEGAKVVLGDVRDELCGEVAASLGDAALAVHLDVSLESDWDRVVEETLGRFGKVDALVNNAAILKIASIRDTSPEDLTRLFQVNQLGPFLGIRAVSEAMKAGGGGSIVNIASSDGVKGMNGVVGYASTKWGVRGVTKACAMELARYRIRVNAVCPEAGNPEMSAPYLPEGVDPKVAAEANAGTLLRSPKGYTMDDHVMDVARTTLFLASDECPTATAADFVIDGGMTAGYIQAGLPATQKVRH